MSPARRKRAGKPRAVQEGAEAAAREAAISDILRVISDSPGDLQPVFDTILAHTTTLCAGHAAVLWQFDGRALCFAAGKNMTAEAIAYVREHPLEPGTWNPTPQAALERRVMNVLDVFANPDYRPLIPPGTSGKRPNAGTVLAVPLVRGDELFGVITIWRYEKRLFSEREVELVKTFTAQAVIAIQNVRLFHETREALSHQTAAAEILRVVSSSTSSTQPVFDAIVQSGLRLFPSGAVMIALPEGDHMRLAAIADSDAKRAQGMKTRFPSPLSREYMQGIAVLEARTVDIADGESHLDEPFGPGVRNFLASGYRAITIQPMMRAGVAIGAISVVRAEPGPLTPSQLALLRTFADQAVIAIENVRLFNETREALEHQQVSADILRIVSQSVADSQPAFEAILAAVRALFAGFDATVWLQEKDRLVAVARGGPTIPSTTGHSVPATPDHPYGAALRERTPVQLDDVAAARDINERSRQDLLSRNRRAVLLVPFVRDDDCVGAISVSRSEPYKFSEKQVALLKNFAAQAVIAIENARLFNETKEALEQQTATADILRVIASSPASVQPVFDAILEKATDLCEAQLGLLFLLDGATWRMVSHRGASPEAQESHRSFQAGPNTGLGRMLRERTPIHIEDLIADAATTHRDPLRVATIEKLGARTFLAVPLLKDRAVIGGVVIYRREVRPFGETQIRLLSTFADQAVIAIENVRLFNETKEALEQQTATAEILKVISSSPTDVQPVFEAIVKSAMRLCETQDAMLLLVRDGALEPAVHFGPIEGAQPGDRVPLDRLSAMGRAVVERRTLHIKNMLEVDPADIPRAREVAQKWGVRTALAVPLLRENEAIGVLLLRRTFLQAFDERQIALLEAFASQAVIALENARLFNETKESLEQQTATADILKVISGSPTDVKPVFDAILKSAVALCDAELAAAFPFDGKLVHLRATHNWSPEALEYFSHVYPSPPSPKLLSGRTILAKTIVEIPDAAADPQYDPNSVITGHWRRMLGVPMLREGEPLGALVVAWGEPGETPRRQVELLQTFANQAAIAIANARLFNETKEALEQQKASADVLSVISASIADTAPVFEKILESCQRLFAGRNVGINVVGDDNRVYIGAYKGYGRAELEAHFPVPLSMDSGSGAAILQRQVVHYADCDAPGVPEYARRGGRIAGSRSVLFAPMLWEGRAIGAVFVGRPVAGAFSEKEIALLKTFADQAAIAIQNARLFREIQEKSAQLEIANRHKSEFLANMSHELRTPLNAIIGFSEVLAERMFGEVNEKQAEYLKDIHESGRHLLSLINDILDLSKIEAGRMELEVSTFDLPTALSNAMTLIRERAQRHGIQVGMELDPALGEFSGDERKFKQIMLNLLSNAVKFTPDGGKVDVLAKRANGAVEVAVRDTGIGIAPEDQQAVFEEFRQVGRDQKRKSEGTGLGLALTKRFVELHGGVIRLHSTPGQGSTFTVSLPLSGCR